MCFKCVSFQWEEFLKLGDDTDDKIVEDKITGQKPEDHCTLIYTVGLLIKYLIVLDCWYYLRPLNLVFSLHDGFSAF